MRVDAVVWLYGRSMSIVLRHRVANTIGSLDIDGRAGPAFVFVAEPRPGEITCELPCHAVRRTGTFTSTSPFRVNNPAIVTASPDAATPVSSAPG